MALCKHEVETASCHDCAPRNCGGSGARPDGHKFGPWIQARFAGECDGCLADIDTGDQIRADGEGGWLCSACGSVTDNSPPALW